MSKVKTVLQIRLTADVNKAYTRVGMDVPLIVLRAGLAEDINRAYAPIGASEKHGNWKDAGDATGLVASMP